MTRTQTATLPLFLRVGMCALCLTMLVSGRSVGQSTEGSDTAAATAEEGETRTINVSLGTSRVIKAPWPVARVSITAPEVVDVQVLTPKQVLLLGKSVGTTDVILWNKKEEMWQSRVGVAVDTKQLEMKLAELFPDCTLTLAQSGETVILQGSLERAEQAAELRRFLEATEIKYVDMTRVAGTQQVQIEVRVAEVSRRAIRTLGINVLQTGTDFFSGLTLGSSSGGPMNPISIGPPSGTSAAQSNVPFLFNSNVAVSPSVTMFAGFPSSGLQVFLQALAENQYLRILAQPHLVALSGEEATFLAGGEYPIPVVQGSDVGGGTSITIEYREFGVRLKVRPTVLGNGNIRLNVAEEVSELSDIGAVVISGFSIPSVLSRKAETTLEMKSGQTFAMAGLISKSNSARVSRVPWLGNLPILGTLFRSIRYTKNETELVVLVKASLVEPMTMEGTAPVPGMLHRPPNDWELFAEGRIEGKTPARISPADAARLKKMGLDRLEGPGAWATYEDGVSRSQSSAEPTGPSASSPTVPVNVTTEQTEEGKTDQG